MCLSAEVCDPQPQSRTSPLRCQLACHPSRLSRNPRRERAPLRLRNSTFPDLAPGDPSKVHSGHDIAPPSPAWDQSRD